ncbi:MAG TPA: hypothetical protein VIK38_11120, partial [Coriobacteriia bacterium]
MIASAVDTVGRPGYKHGSRRLVVRSTVAQLPVVLIGVANGRGLNAAAAQEAHGGVPIVQALAALV